MITVRHVLKNAAQSLQQTGSARLECELLLSRAMGVNRAHLFAHPERPVSDTAHKTFQTMLDRRRNGEPIAYITGEKEFWSLQLEVSPAVLIPRPETEILVEVALARIGMDVQQRVADLGTGSGAIAIAIAHERPACEVHASDISAASLEVASRNASRLGLENIRFHRGSWLEPLSGAFDLIASNPPYVAAGDPHLGEGDLRFEPTGALVGGCDGLDAIRDICKSAKAYLRPGGWLILEHGHDQSRSCLHILCSEGYDSPGSFSDLEGNDRVAAARYGTP